MSTKKKKPKKYDWTWIVWRELEHGITQYECYIKSDPAPAGLVWGTPCVIGKGKKPVFLVQHSFVHLWARRKGVRTAIHKEMMKHYSAIFTYTGTPSGAAWMVANDYKKLRPWGLWIKDMAKGGQPVPEKRKKKKKVPKKKVRSKKKK